MQVASGDLFECAPVERVTAGPDPEPCALPYVYRGRNRTDCVWVGGVEACKVGGGRGEGRAAPVLALKSRLLGWGGGSWTGWQRRAKCGECAWAVVE